MLTIADEEITLRPPVAADAGGIATAVQASVRALAPWMPWATDAYDENAAREWIRLAGAHEFVIVDATGTTAGSCGLNLVDPVNRRANLGYWLRSDRTGRGLATRATRLLARYGLTDLGFERLEIVAGVDNLASRRVAERAGATFEGILRGRLLLHGQAHDACSYSFTSADLAPSGDLAR